LRWLVLASALCACGGEANHEPARSAHAQDAATRAPASRQTDAGKSAAAAQVAYLSATEHLTRASLALRGVRPNVDELQAVHKDPNYLEAIVDYYLTTPQFGLTMRELHEEALLTSVDPVIYPAGFPAIGALAGRSLQEINLAIEQAPLRLIEHVITNDRPYSEIVTADYTFANDIVATVWGLKYDASGPDWQETAYPDREAAGILSDSFVFTRHSTTFSNKNRGRANAISRALLCYDFLSREIPIDSGINLADPDAVSDAVRKNPACMSCHQTLDPLAAYFAPYYPTYVPSDVKEYPFEAYQPAFREAFRAADPGYFGTASSSKGGLRELGAQIADDPRFSLCAAKRFYSYLAQVDLDAVPPDLADELQAVLVDSQMNAKALAKAVVLSDAFRASHALVDDGADELVGLQKLRPSQLARSIAELTGYRFRTELPLEIGMGIGQVGEIDLMADSFFGWKVLAGGIDGNSVTRPSHTMNATVALTLENLSARAAEHVVDVDFAQADHAKRHLLRSVDAGDSDEAAIRAQVVDLELRLHGAFLAADDPAVDEGVKLFRAARDASGGDGARAWKVTLHAMLQDIRTMYY
jgi:hypothetical protein